LRERGGGVPGNLASPVGAEVVIDGRPYINFAGSSYLGLAGNEQIIAKGSEALRIWGCGAPFLRGQGLASGPHLNVEAEACAYFSSRGALFIASGYLFGFVAVAALRGSGDVVFFDEFAHYSLHEAIAASGLRSHAYRHRDAEHLEMLIGQHLRAQERPLVVTDGLFAAMGEIAPLRELSRVSRRYEGRLLIDESHAFGVLGPSGRGAHEQEGIEVSSALIGGSFGKAFGVCGGIVLGGDEEMAACRVTPAALGASAGLTAAAAMSAESLRYVREHPELLARLRSNVRRLKRGLRGLGLDVRDSEVPVAAFVTESERSMQSLRAALMAEGLIVYHVDYAGTPRGGVIRCGIFADHTDEHIDCLVDALRRHL
jgi:7-keto-8-aminopelargonate synthetase-like enzyme